MPVYEYKCDRNGHRQSVTCDERERNDLLGEDCAMCSGKLKRVYSLAFPTMIHEHFNPATGTVVSGATDFKRQLKAASRAATERTNIPHDYEPMSWQELRDQSPNPDAGMKETHDRQVLTGEKEPSKKIL